MAEEEKRPSKVVSLWLKFIFGSISGMVSTTIIQPADLVKTRMQLLGSAGKNLSGFQVAKGIVQRKGIKGLYAGISAALLRQVLYGGGRLGSFNSMLDAYIESYGNPSLSTKVLMGSVAGSVGAFLGMPAEVSLIRMTTDGRLPIEKRKNYKNVFDCIRRMVQQEGIGILGRGLWPTLSRSSIVNGAQLASYAQSREVLLPGLGDGMILHFCASLISGFVTTFVSLPVDMIKTSTPLAKKE